MCLVAFALEQHPDYPLILIANRDEFFDRPTQALHQWADNTHIYGGRDLEAQGTWLAVNNTGRWAALTNFRDPNQTTGSISRGQIVRDCLSTELPLLSWLEQLNQNAALYTGFNLVAGDTGSGQYAYYSNKDNRIRRLTPGIHAVSNGKYQDDWPKMQQLRAMLSSHIEQGKLSEFDLFDSLAIQTKPASQDLPNTGIPKQFEERLASPFITPFAIDKRLYGTRSSAILKITSTQHAAFCERTINDKGNKTSEILLNLPLINDTRKHTT